MFDLGPGRPDPPYPLNWDANFSRASDGNRRRTLGLDPRYCIIEGGGPALRISGFPFPDAASGDQGAKVLWNRWYLCAKVAHSDLPLSIAAYSGGALLGVNEAEYYAYYCEGAGPATPPDPSGTIWRDAVVGSSSKLLTHRYLNGKPSVAWTYGSATDGLRQIAIDLRHQFLSPASLTADDLFVWSGDIQDFDWLAARDEELDVPIASNKILLQRGESWSRGTDPMQEWLSDLDRVTEQWTIGDTHVSVRRGVLAVEGVPKREVAQYYNYARHVLYFDRENFFLYARALYDGSGRLFRTLEADLAPAWNANGDFSLPFSTVHRSVDTNERVVTYVFAGNTDNRCRFNQKKLAIDDFNPGRLTDL